MLPLHVPSALCVCVSASGSWPEPPSVRFGSSPASGYGFRTGLRGVPYPLATRSAKAGGPPVPFGDQLVEVGGPRRQAPAEPELVVLPRRDGEHARRIGAAELPACVGVPGAVEEPATRCLQRSQLAARRRLPIEARVPGDVEGDRF